jgi:hypothetical protein
MISKSDSDAPCRQNEDSTILKALPTRNMLRIEAEELKPSDASNIDKELPSFENPYTDRDEPHLKILRTAIVEVAHR